MVRKAPGRGEISRVDVPTRPRERSETRARPTARERRALLAAGEAVLAERGFARTTVQDVAERAHPLEVRVEAIRIEIGALLRALNDQFVERVTAAVDEATRPGIWRGAPARDVVEVAVRMVLDVVFEHQGLVRAFLVHGATDPAVAGGLRAIGTHLSSRLLAVLGESAGAPARSSRTVAFSLLVSVALAHHTILVGDEWSGVSFSKEQLAEETVRMVGAYLGLEPTIAILDAIPDGAPTTAVRAVREE